MVLVEVVMATNHNLDTNKTERLIYQINTKETKVGWNRELDSPRQKMRFFIFCRGDFNLSNNIEIKYE